MREFTRDSPGCFHSMMEYLSQQTGISQKKTIEIKQQNQLYINPKAKKKKLRYYSGEIVVITTDGKRVPYMGKTRYDIENPDIQVDHFETPVYRNWDEFGLTIHKAGSYKDCLGGGWTCSGPMVSVNGQFFAPEMECAHR